MFETRAAVPVCGTSDPRAGGPTTNDVILRLRESAGRMVAFSQNKKLLREAASAIERLDTDVRNRAADVARLTAELKVLRATPGSS